MVDIEVDSEVDTIPILRIIIEITAGRPMEDGWDSHVSPLMIGVGMGEMHAPHHHPHDAVAMGPHGEMAQDLHADLDQEIGHHDLRGHHQEVGGAGDYYSHQNVSRQNKITINGLSPFLLINLGIPKRKQKQQPMVLENNATSLMNMKRQTTIA
ncbi:unnamed protein product [Phaedon cochleariae]|uniref:Uncharacterized protein n=1 Tax=Phaedon cochleariae TaxID=80249 RepID=A0A9N9SIL5_PHACE|nr:unnamed protein product [Phaedon cochleariae]